jgi:hypothetical protein
MPPCLSARERKNLYVFKYELRTKYGLTPAMIAELGEPDELRPNPHYRSGPPANLFLIERVEAWVRNNQERVTKAKEQRAKRAEAAVVTRERKRAERFRKAKEWVNSLTIVVPKPLSATLLDDAWMAYRPHPYAANLTSKALHAFVGQELTNYNDLRCELRRHEFQSDLQDLLKNRVDSAVTAALNEWHTLHPDAWTNRRGPLIMNWKQFIDRMTIVEGKHSRLTTRLPLIVERWSRNGPELARWPTTESEMSTFRRSQSESLAVLLQIGWHGRKLLKLARKNPAGVWRVPPSVAKALMDSVPEYNSPYGPRLTDCLDVLTKGAGPATLTSVWKQ